MSTKPSLDTRDTRLISILLLAVLALQAWLIFQRAINWDEFLHFGQVYELADGRLSKAMQTLHTRFGFVRYLSDDIITQIQLVRAFMLACVAITAACVALLAQKWADRTAAFLCGLVYLTAGFVFTNAFTYRPDPVAAAALMAALCLAAFGRLNWWRIVLAGLLIGIAGAMTVKSIFYLPCFAALALRHGNAAPGQRIRSLLPFAAIAAAGLISFALIVLAHGAGMPAGEDQAGKLGKNINDFLEIGQFENIRYVLTEMVLAPVVTIGLLLLPFAARGMETRQKFMLLGLCAPLLCLLFYRNTFPYFFTFLLPPICVAIAPTIKLMTDRYGRVPVIGLALLGPAILLAQEPWGTLERQRATLDEVERLYPQPTPYLSYSNYVPHFPRQFPSLISGIGLNRYWQQREGQIVRDIEAGKIAFVIATGDVLDAVYKSADPVPMLPERDVTMLRENYLKHSDTIYIAGRTICPKSGDQALPIHRPGPHALQGGAATINGVAVADGATITLPRGKHKIIVTAGECRKLWALDHVPELPEDFPVGPIAGGF